MKVTPLIIEKLLNDKIFRLNTALALGVTERNVQQLAERNSDNLTKMAAVKYYKSTGLKESEIFESEKQSA
jgi:heterodisulfide reductase subunit B